MKLRVKRCCCCVPIKIGAYIIGGIHVLGLIIGIVRMSPVSVSLDIFCGSTFLYMIYRDSQKSRLLYFATYAVYAFVVVGIHLIFVFWKQDEK